MGEEFAEQFGIFRSTFCSKDISRDLGLVAAMAKVGVVDFKLGEDGDKVVAIHHSVKLHLFEMWC